MPSAQPGPCGFTLPFWLDVFGGQKCCLTALWARSTQSCGHAERWHVPSAGGYLSITFSGLMSAAHVAAFPQDFIALENIAALCLPILYLSNGSYMERRHSTAVLRCTPPFSSPKFTAVHTVHVRRCSHRASKETRYEHKSICLLKFIPWQQTVLPQC